MSPGPYILQHARTLQYWCPPIACQPCGTWVVQLANATVFTTKYDAIKARSAIRISRADRTWVHITPISVRLCPHPIAVQNAFAVPV